MENLSFLGVPKFGHTTACLILMSLNIGTPKNHHFPFVRNGKVVVLGVPIFKHFRVLPCEAVTLCMAVILLSYFQLSELTLKKNTCTLYFLEE